MGNRIRFFLLLLTLAFIGTALMIRYTIGDEDMLQHDTGTLSDNIHKRERLVEKIFEDSLTVKTFENVEKYPLQVSEITKKHVIDNDLFLYIYKDHIPIHWSSNTYVPVNDLGFKAETSFIYTDNRAYVVKRKVLKQGVSVLALIPIKNTFNTNNEYLKNEFNARVLKTNNIDIAKYTDTKLVKNIYSLEGNYLFSVKLKEGKYDNIFINLQFICWILAVFCFIILINNICLLLTKAGYAWLSIGFFAFTLIAIRYLDLATNWLGTASSSAMFDPKYYAYSSIFPNLWSFFMTSISIFWLICYIHGILKYIKIPTNITQKYSGNILAVIALVSIYYFTNLLYAHLGTLQTNTSFINSDFTKTLDLKSYSWFNTLIFCINITILLLYIDFVLFVIKRLILKVETSYLLQGAAFLLSIVLTIVNNESIYLNLMIGAIVLIRSYNSYRYKQIQLSTFIVTILLISIMSTISHTKYVQIKREENMKVFLMQLEAEDDINALSLFAEIEDKIADDSQLNYLFELSLPYTDGNIISEYIKNRYLTGYLSKFDFNGYYYLSDNIPLENYSQNWIEYYRDVVINKSTKVSGTKNFYRIKGDLGTHEYFSQIDIPLSNGKSVHLYLNFKNKSYSTTLPYPEILTDSRFNIWQQDSYTRNSFALYKQGQLITQNGKYIYPNSTASFPKEINEFIRHEDNNGYLHMVYSPDANTTLIMSKPDMKIWEFIAVISFIFIILYIFFNIYNIVKYIFNTVTEKSYHLRNIKYHFYVLRNTIQYSTRIQSLVIGSVILGILISGLIAFVSISKQLESNKEEEKLKNITTITRKIENKLAGQRNEDFIDLERALRALAEMGINDFNLYERSGKLIYSSQPRIFDLKLLSSFINPEAYKNIRILKKSEVLEKEQIGDFHFSAAYSAIRNSDFQTIAFLNIPNFTSKKDENRSNNLLLNTILNIYTVIIIVFGFLSVIVSNTITKPLSIIQRKLAQTSFSDKPNEPLFWERNDEIGTIVKEYNYMLVKLEESTKKLRNAERESAWREMAKQVAHEIKNPLTPMKLGIQQLDRSFKENDPKFAERFHRISNSFIEQIESLSRIANEFSAFAKLPDTRLTKINILEKITKTVNLYATNPISSIQIINQTGLNDLFVYGDKDQLLRTFNNLIKNSIEAAVIRKKHKITIYISLNSEEELKIQIKDNGSGISPSARPNIFRPNFTTKSSGTGLGLAFVKQTVDGMSGSITFETSTAGTNFIITLPLYKKQ